MICQNFVCKMSVFYRQMWSFS